MAVSSIFALSVLTLMKNYLMRFLVHKRYNDLLLSLHFSFKIGDRSISISKWPAKQQRLQL